MPFSRIGPKSFDLSPKKEEGEIYRGNSEDEIEASGLTHNQDEEEVEEEDLREI